MNKSHVSEPVHVVDLPQNKMFVCMHRNMHCNHRPAGKNSTAFLSPTSLRGTYSKKRGHHPLPPSNSRNPPSLPPDTPPIRVSQTCSLLLLSTRLPTGGRYSILRRIITSERSTHIKNFTRNGASKPGHLPPDNTHAREQSTSFLSAYRGMFLCSLSISIQAQTQQIKKKPATASLPLPTCTERFPPPSQ